MVDVQPTESRSLQIPVGSDLALRAMVQSLGNGAPFLFVHGLASNARLWDEVADAVAAAGHPSIADKPWPALLKRVINHGQC